MIDMRPVGYVIGILVVFLGLTMLAPLAVDFGQGNGHWPVFATSAAITIISGGFLALASSNGTHIGLDIQKTFLLTTLVWVALSVFAAIPFILGFTNANLVDAIFEAVSGITTTGSTVFNELDKMPKGLLLWRGILQWLGGIGIIVVAMVFLPELRVGGMQIFRAEGFDTLGKILPRATTIAFQISIIYVGITIACGLSYVLAGMNFFDAVVHAFTTVATGGFSNYDGSFSVFSWKVEYVAILFMILSALPFVRYVQFVNGQGTAVLKDPQVKTFIFLIILLVLLSTFVLSIQLNLSFELVFRKALFNITSILTGTGYASTNYMLWGGFLVSLLFFVGLIGGCAGSTTCSVKIFRYQIVFASIASQLKRIHSPNGVFIPRYQGRQISDDILNSVLTFFVVFFASLGILAVLLSLTGLDLITSLSGAAAALANIGPGLGETIGPDGNFSSLSDTAKWLLIAGMLIGRLELMAVYILFTLKFWRN
ncbi:MAG: Trk system potassium uptake protein [Rhodobacterales bacterium]|nr:MAG: Trk system potassium uptake protein [Rhodobacterales bacterium]